MAYCTDVYRVEKPKKYSKKPMMVFVGPINQDPGFMTGYDDYVTIGQR